MPKIYSQIAEILIYKMRDFGDDRTIFSNFFSHSKIIFIHRSTKMKLFGESWKSIIIEQKFKKFDFFKMSQLLTPTMIIENTQLGKVVSPPKGLERCFNSENEEIDFVHKRSDSLPFLK